jgi:tetratricopeptide (TPR) repeat protein
MQRAAVFCHGRRIDDMWDPARLIFQVEPGTRSHFPKTGLLLAGASVTLRAVTGRVPDMSIRRYRWLGSVLVLAALAGPPHAAQKDLLGAQEVLGRIENAAGGADQVAMSPPAALLAAIRTYRKQSAGLPAVDAVSQWFALHDRALQIDANAAQTDIGAYDFATQQTVGVSSVFASLPPPGAWLAFREEATRRALRAPADRAALALQFLAELLTADRAAAARTLAKVEAAIAGASPDERDQTGIALALLRTRFIRTYGTPAELAAAFEQQLAAPGVPFGYLEIPDLVGLVGEAQAGELLIRAMRSGSTLRVTSGDATRALARRVALEHIGAMRVAQWGLADSVDSAALYEAIERRFDPAAAASEPGEEREFARRMDDYRKREASGWYFMAAVIEGRQADAERALATIAGDSEAYVPRGAVKALREAGHDEALFRFLDRQLERRPEIRAWDLYTRQAAFTGHSADALALIDRTLKRRDLPEYTVADLRIRRVAALLAADRLDQATADLRSLLQAAPLRSEPTLELRSGAALKAAAVGRLAGKPALVEQGLRFALEAEKVRSPKAQEQYATADHSRALWRELRNNDRIAEVQRLAIEKLEGGSGRSGFGALYQAADPAEATALVELAGIWSAAGRHADVLRLVEDSTRWGVSDAGPLLASADSIDVPLGVMLARALQQRGDREAALRVARATVSHLPGKDAAYELIAELDPSAVATFDALYALDPFEERPLIWKAQSQLGAGAISESETTVRRAIALDPSDGEQGANDRMRAYAVLAQILKRKGDGPGAETFTRAVSAIRLSEAADAYYEAGMYERAFAGYRDALERFSDAYCIQSRLAVQLNQQGRRTEALEHYRRAYELMPDSFGRVESHCFGCENVFEGGEAQSVAERVFTDVIRKSPGKPQAHYLLAYLRIQQGRPEHALQPLRQAVSLDPGYLNAWVRLNDLGKSTYIEPGELDIARLKLLELDPLRRHATYELVEVGDFAALWRGVERASTRIAAARPIRSDVFPLRAAAAAAASARDSLSPDMLQQMETIDEFYSSGAVVGQAQPGDPAAALFRHQLIAATLQVAGINHEPNY